MIEVQLAAHNENILEIISTQDDVKIGEFDRKKNLLELDPVSLSEANTIMEMINMQVEYFSNDEPEEIGEAY